MARKPPRPDTPPPPPTVQKVAVRYAKRGPLRFASHRVLQRAFERAVRRAEIPIAYSAGFSPHPRLSYLGAAPTGSASEAEYLLIRLAAVRDPDALADTLNASLPRDLRVLRAVQWEGDDLPQLLEASRWSVRVPGATADAVRAAASAFLASSEASVAREVKKGRMITTRELDVRTPVLALEVSEDEGVAHVVIVIRHTQPVIRPTDVLAAMGGEGLWDGAVATRLAQGRWDGPTGALSEPF